MSIPALQKGNMSKIRQHVESSDCGYFACYAMKLLEDHGANVERALFCQNDVYRMREKRRGRPSGANQVYEYNPSYPAGGNLTGGQAAEYFLNSTLGCKGYKSYTNSGSRGDQLKYQEFDVAWQILNNNVGTLADKRGLVLNCSDTHWVAVLGYDGGACEYRCWDPARGLLQRSEDDLVYRMTQFLPSLLMRGEKPSAPQSGGRTLVK